MRWYTAAVSRNENSKTVAKTRHKQRSPLIPEKVGKRKSASPGRMHRPSPPVTNTNFRYYSSQTTAAPHSEKIGKRKAPVREGGIQPSPPGTKKHVTRHKHGRPSCSKTNRGRERRSVRTPEKCLYSRDSGGESKSLLNRWTVKHKRRGRTPLEGLVPQSKSSPTAHHSEQPASGEQMTNVRSERGGRKE